MPIRPLDMQIMMPKVNEIGKLINEEQQRNQGLAQQQIDNTKMQAKESTSNVYMQKEVQKASIKEKEEKERKNKKNKKNKQNQKEKHSIDIRI